MVKSLIDSSTVIVVWSRVTLYVDKAVKSLEIFPKSEARSDLESLANLTVERNF